MNGFSEVATGVFLADAPALPEIPVLDVGTTPDLSPPADLLRRIEASGDFLTATDFGRAGVDAGKTANYGHGVMRDIALSMVGIDAREVYTVNGRGRYLVRGTAPYDLHFDVFYTMNNPDLISHGSKNRLLLSTNLVHDIWRAGEGYPGPGYEIPRFAKVGHRVISSVINS